MTRTFCNLFVLALLAALPAAAAEPTEPRDKAFTVKQHIDLGGAVMGRAGFFADIDIPPDFKFLDRFYFTVDCGAAENFLVTLEWEHSRFGPEVERQRRGGVKLPGGPYELVVDCTPGELAAFNFTEWMHRELRPGDHLRVELSGLFVEWLTVVMDYQARTTPGPPGQDGRDGRDGRDGIDGKPGRDGVDGKPGKDGRDGKGKHKYLELLTPWPLRGR